MNDLLTPELKRRLTDVVGEDALFFEGEVLDACVSAEGSELPGTPLCVARPAGAGQVKGLVDLARAEGINLVPISSGPPHLKGGSIPAEPAVMVDFSRMDRIVRVDRRNRVALVEPGVTFPALEREANRQGLRVLAPLAPRPGKSVLASCLEREPFLIPKYHFDTTDPLLCAEVVFGSGDFFRTGSAAGPGSLEDQWALGNAQKNPMGPASSDLGKLLQGSQGTLGLVTWGTVKLEVKPSIHRFFFIQAGDPAALNPFVYEACRRRLGDEMLVLDATALAALLGGNPDEIRACAGRQAPYTLIYAVSGIEGMLPEKRVAYQEKDLGAVARSHGLAILREVPGANGARMVKALRACPEGPYWRARLKGSSRDVFFITTLDRAPGLISIMEEACARHAFPRSDMGVYIQPVQQGRSCHLEFQLFYNPSEKAETARAHELVREACPPLAEAGAFFSRPHEPWNGVAYGRCPDTVYALRELKKIFDPGNVLNRGKLCFAEAGAAGAAGGGA